MSRSLFAWELGGNEVSTGVLLFTISGGGAGAVKGFQNILP